jgi:hypothetical protein
MPVDELIGAGRCRTFDARTGETAKIISGR